jgi:D-alanyl-D-alanine carboxypeptidase
MSQINAAMSRRTVLSLAAASAAGVLLPGCSGSGDEPTLSSEIQARFQQALDRNRALFNFPGAQAGVWTSSGSWVGVSGASAPGGNRPPARDDHTRIGSITKTFTVMLLLQLVDQKLVSLEDPIGKYIPGLPNGETATLRMLASMTSGIPSYTFDAVFLDAYFSDPRAVFTPQQLVTYVKGKAPDFPAGTRVAYSNTNTVALGMVIELRTGKPFAQVLKENIVVPLGLTQTLSPGPSNALPTPNLRGVTLQAYPADTIKDATDWNPSWGFSAGDMISTLDDLRRWAVALGTGEGLVSPEMQKQRVASMTSTVPPNSPAMAYALGFGVSNGWIGHTGELPGFNTSIQFDPRTRTTVLVMVNSDIAGVNAAGIGIDPAPTISGELIAALPG